MLTVLAYLCDLAIIIGYCLVSYNKRFVYSYLWVNLVTNGILTPYAFIQNAPAEGWLGIAFAVISIYGLVKHHGTSKKLQHTLGRRPSR